MREREGKREGERERKKEREKREYVVITMSPHSLLFEGQNSEKITKPGFLFRQTNNESRKDDNEKASSLGGY